MLYFITQTAINQSRSVQFFLSIDVHRLQLSLVGGREPSTEGMASRGQVTRSLGTNQETPFITIKNQIYFLRLQKKGKRTNKNDSGDVPRSALLEGCDWLSRSMTSSSEEQCSSTSAPGTATCRRRASGPERSEDQYKCQYTEQSMTGSISGL